MTYHIGQIIPARDLALSLTGAPLERAVWHIVRAPSGRERWVQGKLSAEGQHCCFPTEERTRRQGGKRITYRAAACPGYLMVKFDRRPRWHAMRDRGVILGMVCRDTPWGPVPYAATEDDVRLFMGLPTTVEEIEAARREALRVRPGDRAEVVVGPGLEMVVRVTAVTRGRVFWETDRMHGETADGACRRLVPDDALSATG